MKISAPKTEPAIKCMYQMTILMTNEKSIKHVKLIKYGHL